ncbi:hypothetical protein ACKKBF_B03355 [Auxenochlorella protothecoides x Auxenochlorella symbiontica]
MESCCRPLIGGGLSRQFTPLSAPRSFHHGQQLESKRRRSLLHGREESSTTRITAVPPLQNGAAVPLNTRRLSNKDMESVLVGMGTDYDPQRLSASFRDRRLGLTSRSIAVFSKLSVFAAKVALDVAQGKFLERADVRAPELRDLLASLGPAFIKVGQALSSRPDLLPPEYLAALATLQDRLPPFPSDTARQLIEAELGRLISQVYSELTPEPVAAASLGQVYRGRLRSTGEEVAVKVQRPGILEQIAQDMVLLRRVISAVDKQPSKLSLFSQPLTPLVDEFAARLFGELDYMQEGRNAERFQALYGTMPQVRTPAIKWEATSRRVLTMEWIEGVKLTDKAAMARSGLSVVQFVDVGIECSLRQLLEHGFFHADPHPGNLLATASGDLVYLDFGMMSEMPQGARYAVIAHIVHLVNRDYRAMTRDYYALDFIDPSIDTSPIAPALAAFFDDVLTASVSSLNFKALVDGLGEVLFRYPFRVPPYYALILRSLTVLEGLALSSDPDYKLLAQAYPYVARRLLTDPAPELRASLEQLVLTPSKQLDWERLENLVENGSRAAEFDPGQVWLLADWVCSPAGTGLRASLTAEVTALLDAVAARAARADLAARLRNPGLAARLVPEGRGEAASAARAELLWRLARETSHATTSPLAGVFGTLADLQGTRPGAALRQLQELLLNAPPELKDGFLRPEVQEMVAGVQLGLMQRAAARAVQVLASPWGNNVPATGEGRGVQRGFL